MNGTHAATALPAARGMGPGHPRTGGAGVPCSGPGGRLERAQ